MTIGNWISIFSIIISLLIFMMPVIYFSGRLSGKIETLISKVEKLEKRFEESMNSFQTIKVADALYADLTKEIKICWDKYDNLKKNVLRMLVKSGEDIAKIDI